MSLINGTNLKERLIEAINGAEDDTGSIIRACMNAIFENADTDDLMELAQKSRAKSVKSGKK